MFVYPSPFRSSAASDASLRIEAVFFLPIVRHAIGVGIFIGLPAVFGVTADLADICNDALGHHGRNRINHLRRITHLA